MLPVVKIKRVVEPLPTEEEKNASVEDNLEKLSPYMDEMVNLLDVEVSEILGLDAPFKDRYYRLLAVADRIGEIMGPVVPCKSGCHHCCMMAVTIDNQEATLIHEATGANLSTKVRMIMDRDTLVQEYMNVPCTFLKDRKCSIYAHRPLVCRTHFNISAFASLCDTVNHPGTDVPAINLDPLWKAMAMLSVETGSVAFADLREFFPHGMSDEQTL